MNSLERRHAEFNRKLYHVRTVHTRPDELGNNESGRDNFSKAGFEYFIAASMQCPASVTGQAAVIALRCKESGFAPGQIGRALLNDNPSIDRLVQIAHKVHTSREKGPAIQEVNFRIVNIISSDFSLAQDMMILDEEYLLHASTTMYTTYIKSEYPADKSRNEDDFNAEVYKKIDEVVEKLNRERKKRKKSFRLS